MNLHKEWIIFVTAGKWQLNGIRIAKKLGLSVLSIDTNPLADGKKYSDIFICCDLNNHNIILNKQAVRSGLLDNSCLLL